MARCLGYPAVVVMPEGSAVVDWLRRLSSVIIVGLVFGSLTLPSAEAQAPAPGVRDGTGPTMTFRVRSNGGNCNGCEWLAAEGPITARTPDDFQRFLQYNPVYRGVPLNVALHSDGGNLVAGLALGSMIREAGFWTSVGRTVPFPEEPRWHTIARGHCMSACAYAFLGGTERSAEAGSLGFHQFYRHDALSDPVARNFTARDLSEDQRLVGIVALYLKSVSADPEILFIAASTPPHEMYRPTEAEMRRLAIITGGVFFSGWTIEPYGAGAVVTGSIRYHSHDQTQLTVFCRRSAPGQVFVMGSSSGWAPSAAPGRSQVDTLRAAIGLVSLSIAGQTVREVAGAQGLADVRVDGQGRAYLTFAMSREDFNRGIGSRMSIRVDLPRYLGAGADLSPPSAGLRDRANVAFRACL